MTISSLAAAGGGKASTAAATASPRTIAKRPFMAVLLLRAHARGMRSIRKGPDSEIVPNVAPEPVEPLRLDDQEYHDKNPEPHQPEIRDDVQHLRRREEEPAERLHRVADQDREERHEDRAEDGPEDRAEPADDDHRQVVDGDGDLELLVVRDA